MSVRLAFVFIGACVQLYASRRQRRLLYERVVVGARAESATFPLASDRPKSRFASHCT